MTHDPRTPEGRVELLDALATAERERDELRSRLTEIEGSHVAMAAMWRSRGVDVGPDWQKRALDAEAAIEVARKALENVIASTREQQRLDVAFRALQQLPPRRST